MRTRVLVAMSVGLILAAPIPVLAEEITLTTYYPSPRGVYNELRAMNNLAIGLMGPITARLQIQGAGTTSATSSLNVTDAAGTPLLFVRDDGRVGIGTASPGAALEVVGDIRLGGATPTYRLTNVADPRSGVAGAQDVVTRSYADAAGGGGGGLNRFCVCTNGGPCGMANNCPCAPAACPAGWTNLGVDQTLLGYWNVCSGGFIQGFARACSR